MEIEIKQQIDKPFFDRQEYTFDVKDLVTPSYTELKTEIAKKLNVGEELIVVKRINQQYGKQKVVVAAYKYASIESLKKYEGVVEKKEEKKAEQPAA